MSKQATLYRMHMHEHICPFGLKSRDLLRREGFKIDDRRLKSRQETERFMAENNVDTTPQTFIDGKRIGGYDDLKHYFGVVTKSGETSYTPVIVTFSMALLMAVALQLRTTAGNVLISTIEIFVALSMCILAIQKLRDMEAFSLQFITYDLLGMWRPRYAYVYAYAEAFAGIGMLAMLPAWLVAPPAVVIGSLGAISVIKAVYIDKRALKCACVGGNSKVPLGAVSLAEDLAMVAMGLWMFLK